MGIDIEIYIRTAPTPDLVSKIRALSRELNADSTLRYPVIDSVAAHDNHIRISSCTRYFGKYYRRGWWPDIRAALLALRDACPPDTQIEYGSDSSDLESGIPLSVEMLAEFDAECVAMGVCIECGEQLDGGVCGKASCSRAPCQHRCAYECAACLEQRCMECDEPCTSEEIKTAVRWCPTHREDGREGRL
jgi:hypothetical protein